MIFRLLVIIVFIFYSTMASSLSQQKSNVVSLDFQNINLRDVLHMLAQEANINLIVSPLISKNVVVHLHDMTPDNALNVILQAHQLVRYLENNAWFVVSMNEFMQKKQDEMKVKNTLEELTEPKLKVWKLQYANASEVVHAIQEPNHTLLSKKGFVYADERTNQISIVDLPSNLALVQTIIQKLDVPVKQVLIEARLASIDSNYERELGLQFSTTANKENSPTKYPFTIAKLISNSMLDVKLAALERGGHGELISSPRLFTANQQTAYIEAGEEIPYQETNESGATTTSFKKAVLSLKVTPHVLPGNKVLLKMQINQDKPGPRLVLGVPAINTRQISTQILAKNGQTIVLGGIFEADKNNGTQGIPFLSKMPLVGLLFQKQNVSENKRELLIFVTPIVIENPE